MLIIENMATFRDVYEKHEMLGKGAFSIVCRCVEKETGDNYAVKIIKTTRMSVRELIKLEREARIGRKLVDHLHIVRLHNAIQAYLNIYLSDMGNSDKLFRYY